MIRAFAFRLLVYISSYFVPSLCAPARITVSTNGHHTSIGNVGRFVCFSPTPRSQILAFFLTNYITRILTFKKTSGYAGYNDYFHALQSFFVPFVGISEAAEQVARGSRFLGKNELDRALLAQALVIVVRQPGWRPQNGDVIRGCILSEDSKKATRPSTEERSRRKKKKSSSRKSGDRSRSRSTAARSRRNDSERDEKLSPRRHHQHRHHRDRSSSRRRSGDRRSRDHHRHRHNSDAGYEVPTEQHSQNTIEWEEPRHSGRLHPNDYYRPSDRYDQYLGPEYPASDGEFEVSEAPRLHPLTLVLSDHDSGIKIIEDTNDWKVHGHSKLPEKYALAKIPSGTGLEALEDGEKKDINISNSYNAAKSLNGVIQVVFSLYTLYSAYGEQTNRYGWAAFGFSVLPYTVMSFLNIIANLIEATYDTLYLIKSDIMDEADAREGGYFAGQIGELKPASRDVREKALGEYQRVVDLKFECRSHGQYWATEVDESEKPIKGSRTYDVRVPLEEEDYAPGSDHGDKLFVRQVGDMYSFDESKAGRQTKFRRWVVASIIVISLLTPYIIIGAISRFRPGSDTTVRARVFMCSWLVVGQVIGVFDLIEQAAVVRRKMKRRKKIKWWVRHWKYIERFVQVIVVIVGFAMAVGGFVEVARQLREYGYCIKV